MKDQNINNSVKHAPMGLLHRIKRRQAIITALACVVVFVTTYALVLPALTLDQEEAEQQGGIDVPAVEEQSGSISFTGKGYEVAADCDGAGLPAGTEIKAKEITQSDRQYEDLYQDALEAVQKDGDGSVTDFEFAKFYDISLMSGGASIEPDNPLNVTISYDKGLNVKDTDNLRILHFAYNEKTDQIKPVVLDSKKVDAAVKGNRMTETTFKAESFSVYAVVYTTDSEDPEDVEDSEDIEDMADSENSADIEANQFSANTLTAEGETFEVNVSFDETAKIPEGTTLDVTEIKVDSEEYIQYLGRTWSEVNKASSAPKDQDKDGDKDSYINVNAARFFDIKLINAGEEIEPKEPVQVEIIYDEGLVSSSETKPGVVHFTKDNKIEILKDVETDEEDDATVSFRYEQDSFSVIGTYIQQETQNAETPPLGARHAEGNNDNSSDTLSDNDADKVVDKALAMPRKTLRAKGNPEQPDAEDTSNLPHPHGNKTLDPNGDGTYTLTLSVKGSSQTTIRKHQKKANVLFVMDRSSSMITNTVSDDEQFWYYGTRDTAVFRQDIGDPNHNTGKNYQFYGVVNGEYIPLNVSFSSWSNPTFTYQSGSHWNGWNEVPDYSAYPTDAPLYVKSKTTRLYAEQEALDDVIGRLLAHNDDETDDVEVAVISFADHRADAKGWTDTEYTNWVTGTDKNNIMNVVNNTRFASGTNWEEALQYANSVISAKKAAEADKPEEDYYVVFLTDGEPTNIVGDTSAAQHTGDAGNKDAYDAAKDDALALVQGGYKFYNIFTYRKNEPVKYSKYLTNYAYSNGQSDYNADDTEAVNNYFSDAQTIEALNDTFNQIFQTIVDTIGHADVSITDTLTTDAMTKTVVEGKTNGYVYTVKDPSGDVLYTVTATGDVNNPTVTFHVPGSETKTYTATPSEEVSGLYSITTVEGNEYRISLADVNNSTGELEWDLSPVGVLMNDCEYSVSFVVWPNQDAYDYVAALNNGLPGYTWDTSLESYQDLRSTKGYEVGGVEGYPSIVKQSNGTFAVLTNTDQKVHYSVVESETINGEPNGEPTVNGPYYQDLQTPDPMPLTASDSEVEKQWKVERDPGILAQILYDLDGKSTEFQIPFTILRDDDGTTSEDDAENTYNTVTLGWDASANDGAGAYAWEPGSERTVQYNGHSVVVGTRWASDFAIATGLMLSEDHMDALGLDKSAYPSGTYNGTTYYVLEEGHDYTIKEPGLTFEFDFASPTYHPMLVDGKLRSVNLSIEGDNVSITGMTSAEVELSALKVVNTLRGYINLDKVVVDKDGKTPVPDDNTKFEYEIILRNSTQPGPFTVEGSHVPWYGINDLYYHDADFNYYQATPSGEGKVKLLMEDGTEYEGSCEGTFEEDVGPVPITFTDSTGTEKTIQLYGNQMDRTSDNYVSSRLRIAQGETLNIANVPVGTRYTITESDQSGYQFVKTVREIRLAPDAEVEDSDTANESTITGTIVANRDNHIIYYNKTLVTDLTIQKTDEDGEGLKGAVFQLKAVSDDGHSEADAATIDSISGIGDVVKTVDGRTETFPSSIETTGGIQKISGLPDGTYRLYEVFVPTGYVSTFNYIQFDVEGRSIKKVTTDTGDTSKIDTTNHNIDIKIANEPGAALPSTGGPGTGLFMVLGSILILGSGALLWRRRKIA